MRLATKFILASCAVGLISCQSDHERGTSFTAGMQGPVIPNQPYPFISGGTSGPAIVTGCTWTNELGVVTGGWGRQQPGSGIATPNPTANGVTIRIHAPIDDTITWWVEKAYGPGDRIPDQAELHVGATFYAPQRVVVAGPHSQFLTAGVHSMAWDGRDAFGLQVPNGYYRVYVTTSRVGLISWWDVLVQRD